MPRLSPSLALAAALALGVPSALEAQSGQRWSLQVSPIAVLVFGDIYEGLNSGFGGEAQLRYTPGALSWGGGVQFSQHELDLGVIEGVDFGSEDVRFIGAFLEPRYVFDVGRNFAPYGAARLSYIRMSTAIDIPGGNGEIELRSSGAQVNVGGGLLFRLSPRINLDLGATVGLVRFGDLEAEFQGETASESGGTGQNLVLRIGLAIGLGG